MASRVRSFLESLTLRPRVEGRSADAQHSGALARHRAIVQNPERAAPQRFNGQWATPWMGGLTPPDDVQNLPDRPPLLDQDAAMGAHEAPFVGYDRLAPTAWDGEPRWGAPNVVEGG